MKLYKKPIILAMLLMLILAQALAGCGKETDKAAKEAHLINEKSDLPMALLTSYAVIKASGDEGFYANYDTFDYRANDYTLSFGGFPTDESGYFLTGITWTGKNYHLFGVKVGDDPLKSAETLKTQGYEQSDSGYIAEFEKNGVSVWLIGDITVEEIRVDLPMEYTSGNVY